MDGSALSARIRDLRKHLGISQDVLADKTRGGIQQARISRIETMKGGPITFDEVKALAEAFGLTVEEFTGEEMVVPVDYEVAN